MTCPYCTNSAPDQLECIGQGKSGIAIWICGVCTRLFQWPRPNA